MSRSMKKLFQESSGRRCFLYIYDRRLLGIIALLSLQLLSGCGRTQQAPGAPPPPAVTVAHPVLHDVMEWDTFNGYLEAFPNADICARVSGMIMDAPFQEGSLVEKNQVLFVLDDRTYKADLALKVADRKKATEEEAITLLSYQRQEVLFKKNGVSQQEYETAKADHEKAKAMLAGTEAAVKLAEYNLEWCNVVAPIKGRVGKKKKTVGNLVMGGSGPGTLLTTIVSLDPIYCTFDVDEPSIRKYRKLAVEKKRPHERDGKVPCYVQLIDEVDFPHVGYIDFLDNQVVPTTGTQQMRARLDNTSDYSLTPGNYAHARIPGSGIYPALLVPEVAIGNDQDQRIVLVVGKDNIVDIRKVKVGALFGDLRAVTFDELTPVEERLKPDDLVIINGQMKAFPGTPVAPTETVLKVANASLGLSAAATPGAPGSVPVDPPAPNKTKTGGGQ
jgi:RND family efflux transporter MFP subunit